MRSVFLQTAARQPLALVCAMVILPAVCAVTDGDFSLSVRADLSSVTNAETLYEASGSFTLKVREAGVDPGLADYDRMLGNYLNWRLPDGRCPVIEAVVTDARRSIHPYYEKEFRGCRVGIPLALVKGGLGDVPVCISCTKTAWRIRIGDIEDEDFLVAPMKPLVAADANIRSDRVKSAAFGPADDRSEPVSRPVSDPIQYWTSGGFNTWVGDVVVANWRDRFHVFYLKDRRHHRSKGGSGGHYFAHVSSPDLVHWDEHPTVTPIEDHWFTCGTGTPFEFGGKFCLAYGVHSTRFVPRARTTEPRMLEELSRTGVMPSYRFAGTDLVPLGSTWAESMDGFVFRPSGIVFHTTQNPAITADPDGSLRLTTGFSEDTGVGGFWGSNGMAGWTKLPGEPPLKGDCPCPFEWNGRNYLLQGFRGYARQKGNGEWETLRGSDVYDGLNVPMVAPWKGGRRLLVGWVRHFYGWGGWLCFRELVQRPDGSLGTKWVPEIVPPSPIREFRLRAGEPFRLRFSGSAGALVELFVNPRDDEAAFADVRPDGTLDEPGDPPIGHSFRVTGIRGLDRDYAVRLVVHYDRKADATLLDAEIAGDRTIVCRRPGMYSPYDSLSM